MVPYGEYDITDVDRALDDAFDAKLDELDLDKDYPSCSDVMAVRMGEALG